MRAAWRAGREPIAPAEWTFAGGRTVALRPCAAAELDAVLVPGLVDAHAHLDLSGAAPLAARASFTEWLLGVGGVRGADRDVAAVAESGARERLRGGVVAVGDVDGSAGSGARGRRRAGLGGRSYLEVLGVTLAGARSRLQRALELVDRLGGAPADLGLSPHAPYSVHEGALGEIVRAARRRGLPLAMHLAETAEETRYLLHGDGPFVAFLEAIGKGAPFARPPRMRPVAYAERAGLLAAGCVVVHGNDLDDADVAILARHRATVVYCHGTHRHFDRPPHRLLALLDAGVGLAFGTDSALSNEHPSLLAELRGLAADRPELAPAPLLTAATEGGRTALGLPLGAARFEPGSAADGVLLAAPADDVESRDGPGLADWVLRGGAPALATIVAGTPFESASGAAPAFLDTPPRAGLGSDA